MLITEGYVDFREFRTYYRIAGACCAGKKPLLLLHGGPGSTHNYFEVLDTLAEEDGRSLIMYDQLGCGESQALERTDLFQMSVWLEELINLRRALHIEECHILGHSWGGMLLLEYICRHSPAGICSIILSSTLPSSSLWADEQRRLVQELPQEMQKAISEAEAAGDYTSEAYKRANKEFMRRHCGPDLTPDSPSCLTRAKKAGGKSYLTAWGPNEYTPLGNLKDFDCLEELTDIRIPALITSGAADMCTPLIAGIMKERIPGAEWVLFQNSRHTAFVEENRLYMDVLKDWLNRHD